MGVPLSALKRRGSWLGRLKAVGGLNGWGQESLKTTPTHSHVWAGATCRPRLPVAVSSFSPYVWLYFPTAWPFLAPGCVTFEDPASEVTQCLWCCLPLVPADRSHPGRTRIPRLRGGNGEITGFLPRGWMAEVLRPRLGHATKVVKHKGMRATGMGGLLWVVGPAKASLKGDPEPEFRMGRRSQPQQDPRGRGDICMLSPVRGDAGPRGRTLWPRVRADCVE